MGDIRGSVVSFLQRTRAKFDYYAGGQFLKKSKPKVVHPEPTDEKDKDIAPPKRKRKRNVLPQTKPAPSAPPPRNVIPFSPIASASPPTNNTRVLSPPTRRKRVRLTKPAKQVEPEPPPINKPPLQGVNYFLDSHNHSDKDQAFYLDLFRKRVRTYKPPPKSTNNSKKDNEAAAQKPRKVKLHTFELVDEEGRKVEEYTIFKDSSKFFGNLDKFSEHGKDCRDNDIQTTYEERRYGEQRSAKVLSRVIKLLSSMQVNELSVAWRTEQVIAEDKEE